MTASAAYLLPPGNVQICFSGGRTSAFMLHQILEANGDLPDRVKVTFENTGREFPQTLDFVQECADRWGVHITWLEYTAGHNSKAAGFRIVDRATADETGQPFKELIRRKRYLPNQAARFCTIELKIRTAKRYLMETGWQEWTNAIGIRHDEPARIRPEDDKGKERWLTWQPLNHAKISKHDVALFWRAQPFDLRLANVRGKTPDGNCDGCFLKDEAYLAALARDHPARHQFWEDLEAEVFRFWPELTAFQRLRFLITRKPELSKHLRRAYGRSIRSSTIKMILAQPPSTAQWSKRYSRAELREFMERQSDAFDPQDGQLCQASDGECTI